MNTPPSSAVLVCGFHRSGTSMLARLLHESGISMGVRLGAPHASNQGGHYEDMDIVALHDSILRRQGDSWQYSHDEAPTISGSDWAAMHLYAKHRHAEMQWGFKDPRLMLFSQYWHKVLPNARWLLIYRHPAECHDSLGQRHSLGLLLGMGDDEADLRFWREPSLAWRMWISYHTILLRVLDSVKTPPLILSHQSLFDERGGDALRAISEFAGVDLAYATSTINRAFSTAQMSLPPLTYKDQIEVDALWRKMGAMAGRFADSRVSCIGTHTAQPSVTSPDLEWDTLATRLDRITLRSHVTEPFSEQPGVTDSPRALIDSAASLANAEHRIDLLSKGGRQFPDSALLWQTLAMAYREVQRFAESAACLEHAAVLAPDNLIVLRQLAYMKAAEKKYSEALDVLDRAWSVVDDNSQSLAELSLQAGQVCLQMKDRQQALVYAEDAVLFAPEWRQAQRFYDDISGQTDPAKYLEKLLDLYEAGQRDAGIVIPLAAHLTQFGRMKEARTLTEAYLTVEPQQLWVRQLHITALHGLGEHHHAHEKELVLWREIVGEPHAYWRVMRLRDGLAPWSVCDLQNKLLNHLEKIAHG